LSEQLDALALEHLAIDTFAAFGQNPRGWPDIVQINRNGTVDANIRGIWSFEDRIEHFHVPLTSLPNDLDASLPTSPESSGDLG